jgi:hypothetical protein
MKTAISLFLLLAVSSALALDRYQVPIDNSPRLGPENAPVTVIEFIDFQ